MSVVSAERATAIRRVNRLYSELPEGFRPSLAEEWGRLLDGIDLESDAEAIARIKSWTAEVEERLSAHLLNAPLEKRS